MFAAAAKQTIYKTDAPSHLAMEMVPFDIWTPFLRAGTASLFRNGFVSWFLGPEGS
jgi:hypothetical protein